jgi:hypothetical protein
MKKSLQRTLLKLFPEAKTSFENDLRIVRKDHPGYSEERQYEELVHRYTWRRKSSAVAHSSK